jgi:hypothetical protein
MYHPLYFDFLLPNYNYKKIPWCNVPIRIPAVVVVGQVAEVLHLFVVEDEGELRRIPFQAYITAFSP